MKPFFLAVGILCALALLNLETPYREAFWNSPCSIKSYKASSSNSYLHQHHHYHYGVWGIPNNGIFPSYGHDDDHENGLYLWFLVIYGILLIPLMLPLYQTFYCHYPMISVMSMPCTIYLLYRTHHSNFPDRWMKRVMMMTLGISLLSELLILINFKWIYHLILWIVLGTSLAIV